MDATRINPQTTETTTNLTAVATAITDFTRTDYERKAKRNLALRRSDWVTAGLMLSLAIAICEPNTNQALKNSDFGKFFSQVKPVLTQQATKSQQQQPKVGGLVPPLPKTAVITSRFGKRFHPVNQVWGPHYGIDISQALGAEIVAIADGTVIDVENSCRVGNKGCGGEYGNLVKIDHGNGFTSLYGHLTQARVKIGQKVKGGDVIGLEGTTGNSSGTHLHLQTEQDGVPFDPEKKLFPGEWELYERYNPKLDGLPLK